MILSVIFASVHFKHQDVLSEKQTIFSKIIQQAEINVNSFVKKNIKKKKNLKREMNYDKKCRKMENTFNRNIINTKE